MSLTISGIILILKPDIKVSSEKMSNISIIIDDGPISRAYLKLFLDKGYKFKKIFYLTNFYLSKNFSIFLNSYKNNFHPVRFLKNKNLYKLIEQFQNYFGFEQNFCFEMYLMKLTENFDINIISSANINSNKVIEELNKSEDTFYLNTTKQILKNSGLFNHKFIHIHPGYLPHIRGMDGSLWNYYVRSKFGVSSFIMSQKIDKGEVILREELDPKEFIFPIYKSFNGDEIRRIWFSFFDPLLRAYHLKNLIKKTNFFSTIEYEKNFDENESSYFSKIDEKKQTLVFDKIFLKN